MGSSNKTAAGRNRLPDDRRPPSLRVLLGREEIRFLLVGVINTVVGYGLFALFLLVFGYLVSLYLSYAVAVSLAFLLHRRFTFRVKGNVLVDFVRFVGVYVVSLAVNSVVLPLLVEIAGLHPLIAQGIALVITTLISYVGHKWFSFRRSSV
ncbi:MAG: GtrA-like protein [Microbacteriaceae bacterium]|jgi:putative flippase GtrA|nr:GtrA-like protein [Microbacteriaceae bacterium]